MTAALLRRPTIVSGLAWAFAICVVAPPGDARAAGPARDVVIVLDASGSMAGAAGGQIKLDAARDVINTLVSAAPPDLNLGLVVYGADHAREEKRCDDVRVAQPLGPVDGASISRALSSVRARGMTPIGGSLRMAAQQLANARNTPTIVLISDGLETCDADPCAVARDLRATYGVEVRVHVVGFALEESEQAQLQCIADRTNGDTFRARDKKELTTAVYTAVRGDCRQRCSAEGGFGPMFASIGHPGLGEWINSGDSFKAGTPKKKFYLGFIPGFGWPGYLQVVSAIDAYKGCQHDWPDTCQAP